ncbi:hypothetical protein V9K67_24425 [Paraflavisolibacter sp. H34]|uniref:hypothetical protein n=1 Tax=Huijunlia imazamoxiresistens TaxID=3127457 RepID=UPI003017DB53
MPVQKTGSIIIQLDTLSETSLLKRRQQELDSLHQLISKLQGKRDSLKNALNKEYVSARQKVYKASNFRELQKVQLENGVALKTDGRIERILSNVKSFGIGRRPVNYSELTLWNQSITGLNIEYNPKIYVALAAGKIDYGFRDFFGKNTRGSGQSILMGRLGMGDKERKAVILSIFTGNKYSSGSMLADTLPGKVNVIGYSLEGIWNKDGNTGISIELGKTTKPLIGRMNNGDGIKGLFNYSDFTNLGISFKGQTLLKGTATRINGFYRKIGQSFQSFNLYAYSISQTAWHLEVNQPLLKNRIGLLGGLRKNDFANPFAQRTYKTSTVFKSLQVTARVPKWPVVSVGYYPASQLFVMDKDNIMENAYYVLNGSVVYHHSLGRSRILSSVVYNQYSSKGTDTGFIAYGGKSYIASQSIIFHRTQLQGSYTYTDQEQLNYYTLEANGDYSFSSLFKAGVGAKYNKVADGNSYIGSRAFLNFDFKKPGSIQLQYEKSFLPTTKHTLFPMEIGRVSWFKFF